MKKIYCCLTWAAMAVALTACGNNQQSAEPAKEGKATVEAPAEQPAAQDAASPAAQETVPPADQAPPAEQGAPATPHN